MTMKTILLLALLAAIAPAQLSGYPDFELLTDPAAFVLPAPQPAQPYTFPWMPWYPATTTTPEAPWPQMLIPGPLCIVNPIGCTQALSLSPLVFHQSTATGTTDALWMQLRWDPVEIEQKTGLPCVEPGSSPPAAGDFEFHPNHAGSFIFLAMAPSGMVPISTVFGPWCGATAIAEWVAVPCRWNAVNGPWPPQQCSTGSLGAVDFGAWVFNYPGGLWQSIAGYTFDAQWGVCCFNTLNDPCFILSRPVPVTVVPI